MEAAFLNLLSQIVSIPSISTDNAYRSGCLETAVWLKEQCQAIGMEHVQLLEGDNDALPVVYGEYLHTPNASTYLIYAHYDIQPPEPLEVWKTKPFEVSRVGDEIFGRGVADDKGHIIALLLALKHLIASGQQICNVKLCFEGEEEKGSVHLKDIIMRHKELFKADAAIILDSGQNSPEEPSLLISLRGIVYHEITVKAHENDLHSGFYGGRVVNPAFELTKLLSSIKNEKNQITIPGFYDDVVPQKYKPNKIHEDKYWVSEEGYTPEESHEVRPSYDINGIWGGFTTPGASKTIIPAEAHAKISFRLVANQNPEKISKLVEDWLKAHEPKGAKVSITSMESASPVFADPNHPLVKKAISDLETVFGKQPELDRSGGTIGAAGDIQSVFQIPLIITGFTLDDANLHAPNEKIHLSTMLKGIEAIEKMLFI